MSRRTERVGRQLHAELAQLLQGGEVTDPRLGGLVLTHVDVSPDLAAARVYWSTLPAPQAAAGAPAVAGSSKAAAGPLDADPAKAEAERQAACRAGLERAAGFLRSRLARRLPLRRVPELRFIHDPSQAEGSQVLARIAELSRGAKP